MNVKDIVVVKLASGADMIGIIDEMNAEESFVELSRPHMLQIIPTPQGMALNMVPLHVFATDPQDESWTVTVHTLQYLEIYHPAQQIEDQFREMLSGIVVARGSIIQHS
jgi:hypothetical protein